MNWFSVISLPVALIGGWIGGRVCETAIRLNDNKHLLNSIVLEKKDEQFINRGKVTNKYAALLHKELDLESSIDRDETFIRSLPFSLFNPQPIHSAMQKECRLGNCWTESCPTKFMIRSSTKITEDPAFVATRPTTD